MGLGLGLGLGFASRLVPAAGMPSSWSRCTTADHTPPRPPSCGARAAVASEAAPCCGGWLPPTMVGCGMLRRREEEGGSSGISGSGQGCEEEGVDDAWGLCGRVSGGGKG